MFRRFWSCGELGAECVQAVDEIFHRAEVESVMRDAYADFLDMVGVDPLFVLLWDWDEHHRFLEV